VVGGAPWRHWGGEAVPPGPPPAPPPMSSTHAVDTLVRSVSLIVIEE